MKKRILGIFISGAFVCAISAPVTADTAGADKSGAVYVAHLQPLNAGIAGSQANGEARFTIRGDQLTIRIDAQGLPPGIMHLQHFHGFKDGGDASCPTQSADANSDGIVDLIETEPLSGTTMVPFTTDPASMKILTDTYPTASGEGAYQYQQNVSLRDLETAFANAFDGQKLNLESRVVYIHGIVPGTALPDSVASLGDIPAQVTLPIACGEIERVGN